jgi:hypothetical protein
VNPQILSIFKQIFKAQTEKWSSGTAAGSVIEGEGGFTAKGSPCKQNMSKHMSKTAQPKSRSPLPLRFLLDNCTTKC